MLQHLFGTTTRYLVLRVLVFNPEHQYSVVELRRKLHVTDAAIRAELQRLIAIQLVVEAASENGKTYHFVKEAAIFPELRALFLKAQLLTEYDFGKKILAIGRIAYAALTGYFTNVPEAKTDIFIVGTVNRVKLRRLVRRFQHDMNMTCGTRYLPRRSTSTAMTLPIVFSTTSSRIEKLCSLINSTREEISARHCRRV